MDPDSDWLRLSWSFSSSASRSDVDLCLLFRKPEEPLKMEEGKEVEAAATPEVVEMCKKRMAAKSS